MAGNFIVYGLVDPFSGQLRYVGQSSKGLRRCPEHWRPSTLKNNTHKTAWLKTVLARGKKPDIVVLEEVESCADLDSAEIFYIGYFKFIGCALTNHTNGGMGHRGFKASEETKRKRSLSLKGRKTGPFSEERIDNIKKGMSRCVKRTHVYTDEEKRKMSERQRGRVVSKETRAKLRKANTGIKRPPRSEEWRQRMAQSSGILPFQDQYGNVYKTVAEAARLLSIDRSCISRVLSGAYSQTSGYTFAFL